MKVAILAPVLTVIPIIILIANTSKPTGQKLTSFVMVILLTVMMLAIFFAPRWIVFGVLLVSGSTTTIFTLNNLTAQKHIVAGIGLILFIIILSASLGTMEARLTLHGETGLMHKILIKNYDKTVPTGGRKPIRMLERGVLMLSHNDRTVVLIPWSEIRSWEVEIDRNYPKAQHPPR